MKNKKTWQILIRRVYTMNYFCPFSLVDEMSKKMKIEEDTYSHLLQACNSDEESGFR